MGKTILQILKTGVFLFLVSNDLETLNSLGQCFCYSNALPRRKWIAFPQQLKHLMYL